MEKLKVVALKNDKMDKGGKYFCYEGAPYTVNKHDEDHYEVFDELWAEPDWSSHDMCAEYFFDHFKIVKVYDNNSLPLKS